MIVTAATEERNAPHVTQSYGINHPLHLVLGPPMTDGNGIGEQQVFTQPIKELVHRINTDGFQHVLTVLIGMGNIGVNHGYLQVHGQNNAAEIGGGILTDYKEAR
jgi:hypothetical protein